MTDKEGQAGAPEISSLNGWVDNGSVNRNENRAGECELRNWV